MISAATVAPTAVLCYRRHKSSGIILTYTGKIFTANKNTAPELSPKCGIHQQPNNQRQISGRRGNLPYKISLSVLYPFHSIILIYPAAFPHKLKHSPCNSKHRRNACQTKADYNIIAAVISTFSETISDSFIPFHASLSTVIAATHIADATKQSAPLKIRSPLDTL